MAEEAASKLLDPVEVEPQAVVKTADKKVAETISKVGGGSFERDLALAEVEKEKNMSFVKAWEDAEMTKAENKASKEQQAITAWENSKKAALEANLKKIEEKLERSKAAYAEKMKNKIALVHKQADEKRAIVDAKRGQEILKAEDIAAKYRVSGLLPKSNPCGCF